MNGRVLECKVGTPYLSYADPPTRCKTSIRLLTASKVRLPFVLQDLVNIREVSIELVLLSS